MAAEESARRLEQLRAEVQDQVARRTAAWDGSVQARKRSNFARCRLHRHRSLQVNARFEGFIKMYQIVCPKFIKCMENLQIL